MNNEDFELHPHYPPPHKDGAYPRYWPYWPQWPAGWHGWNDTEPASVGPWGCCPPPHPDDCVCVTQQDIDNWNNISAVSALSGIDLSPLSSISGMDLPYSATLWNSCYDTVYENSAVWNSAMYVPDLYANFDALSAYTADSINFLSAHEGYVTVDRDFRPYNIEGEGTSAYPLALNPHVVQLLYYLDTGNDWHHKEDVNPGLPDVPKNQWIATRKELELCQSGVDYNHKKNVQHDGDFREVWDAISLILNIITDKYKDDEVKGLIKDLHDKVENYYFVADDKWPNM